MVLFYGSQTGTAEEFASRLAKEANRYGMKALVADPEECSMDDLTGLVGVEKSVAIFVLATYGEGDPTDNAQELMEWLKAGESDLTGIKYAVSDLLINESLLNVSNLMSTIRLDRHLSLFCTIKLNVTTLA